MIREADSYTGIRESIAQFLYGQGVTLLVFFEAMKIESYPALAYIQNFIPGTSTIYSFFDEVYRYQNNFGYYLGYMLNEQAYNDGYGLGWSVYADIYLFSLRNPILYVGGCVSISFLINVLDFKSYRNSFYLFLILVLIQPILFLPRSGLNTVIPLIFYSIVIYFTLMKFFVYKKGCS